MLEDEECYFWEGDHGSHSSRENRNTNALRGRILKGLFTAMLRKSKEGKAAGLQVWKWRLVGDEFKKKRDRSAVLWGTCCLISQMSTLRSGYPSCSGHTVNEGQSQDLNLRLSRTQVLKQKAILPDWLATICKYSLCLYFCTRLLM